MEITTSLPHGGVEVQLPHLASLHYFLAGLDTLVSHVILTVTMDGGRSQIQHETIYNVVNFSLMTYYDWLLSIFQTFNNFTEVLKKIQ